MKILGISGRKQSGKNTIFNSILGYELLRLSVVRDKIAIMPSGKLWVSDIFGDEQFAGIFDVERQNDSMLIFLNEYVYPYVKNYSFADRLKKDICINILGLDPSMMFGTDEEKSQPTHLKWEDMPGVLTEKGMMDMMATREVRGRLGHYYDQIVGTKLIYHPPGFMTGREVLQFVGTNIFRRMYGKVWAHACIKQITSEESSFAIITDCRFPDEVDAIHEAGGKVVRLTRTDWIFLCSKDVHDSEVALDQDRYDWTNFDAILDNANMTIGEQQQIMIKILQDMEFI